MPAPWTIYWLLSLHAIILLPYYATGQNSDPVDAFDSTFVDITGVDISASADSGVTGGAITTGASDTGTSMMAGSSQRVAVGSSQRVAVGSSQRGTVGSSQRVIVGSSQRATSSPGFIIVRPSMDSGQGGAKEVTVKAPPGDGLVPAEGGTSLAPGYTIVYEVCYSRKDEDPKTIAHEEKYGVFGRNLWKLFLIIGVMLALCIFLIVVFASTYMRFTKKFVVSEPLAITWGRVIEKRHTMTA